ncbi:MAG: hypothetical protein J0H43_15755, partial [Actinobacteria bacterium]|nr:hypothetical protein [Actinomycetota bacterium]
MKIYPAGTTPPATTLNWPNQRNYEWTTAVSLPTSGQLSLYLANGPANLSISVLGYFTAATGPTSVSQFTPAATRVYDSRNTTSLASGTSRTIQVAGVNGVPVAGAGISAVAINYIVISGTSANGHLDVGPSGGSLFGAVQYYASGTESALSITQLGPDGA